MDNLVVSNRVFSRHSRGKNMDMLGKLLVSLKGVCDKVSTLQYNTKYSEILLSGRIRSRYTILCLWIKKWVYSIYLHIQYTILNYTTG